MSANNNSELIGAGDRFTRWNDVALTGIYEISKILTRPARIESTLCEVISYLSSYFGMRNGLIALLGDNDEPQVVVSSQWNEETSMQQFERLPERAIGQIVTTELPLVVRNMSDDPLFAGWESAEPIERGEVRSFIGVPIRDREEVIGTITVEVSYQHEQTVSIDEDVRFLKMIANLVGQTVRLQVLIARDRERLMEVGHQVEKLLETREEVERDRAAHGIVGESRAIRQVLEKIAIVARSHLPVLLRGESGTGKELFAQAVHNLSPRKNHPCIKLNCAALPESVLESELFGHEKGAFTGAIALRKGRFELADGGTLFLDEIGDITPAFQAKLLRVLQEGEFERVGGSRTIRVNVRLVAATNRDLEQAVARGEFRADLYYRISVVPIMLAPLRERREDIPLLAREFLKRYNETHGTAMSISDEAVNVLTSCDFPGNVRELESCVSRTAAFAKGTRIVADDFACRNDSCLSSVLSRAITERNNRNGYIPLPVAISPPRPRPVAPRPSPPPLPAQEATDTEVSGSAEEQSVPGFEGASDDASEREHLIEAMEKAGWVQAKAARLLGVTPRQMGYALRKHDIPIKRF